MKRKSVLAAVSMLIAAAIFFLFASCTSKDQNYTLHEEYFTQNNYTSPYLFFHLEDQRWYTGQGMVFDHVLNGEYKISGNRIVCHEHYWDLTIELELIGDELIKVTSVKDKDNVLLWLNEGDILTYFDKS